MKPLAILVVFLALFIFPQCDWEEEEAVEPLPLCDECLDAAPDGESLAIRIPGDEDDYVETQTLGELAELYTDTRQTSRDLNFWILGTLGWFDEILTIPPTEHDGGFCVWGPFVPDGLSPVEVRFRMQRHSADDYDYFWEERLKNTSDDWTMTWGGSITPATSTARRGIGELTIDFDASLALDPTREEAGEMFVDYDTITDGRRIDITFVDFQDLRPGEMSEPVDAEYHYHNYADNAGEFSMSFVADIHEEDFGDRYPGEETVHLLTEWLSSGAGGATRTISGGDLGDVDLDGLPVPLTQVVEDECWDELFARTYYRMVFVFEDGSETTVEEEGDAGDCVL